MFIINENKELKENYNILIERIQEINQKLKSTNEVFYINYKRKKTLRF
jgi:hypothetical protein